MSEYYGRGSLTQCEFVRKVLGGPACPNTTASLALALRRVPCLVEPPHEGVIDVDRLRNQILFGFPVCLHLNLRPGLGHVVVAVRCSTNPDAFVRILDPASQGSIDLPYRVLAAGGYKGRWVGTYLTS